MPATVFADQIFPGAKIITASLSVSNTSGSYSTTVSDDRMTGSMKAIALEIADPSVFNGKITVNATAGQYTFSCPDTAGSTTVVISFLKTADDPTQLTSSEFDVLNNSKLSLVGGTLIGQNANLNSYTGIGNYYIATTADAETIQNIPVQLAGTLYVKGSMLLNTDYLQQFFIPYNQPNVWIRHTINKGSAWSAWVICGSQSTSWTPTLARDTISELTSAYASREGNIVQCTAKFKVTAHSGGNSYIDASCLPNFGKTIVYTWGVWNSETVDNSGILHGSNNGNVWFVKGYEHFALGTAYANNYIWLSLTYRLA